MNYKEMPGDFYEDACRTLSNMPKSIQRNVANVDPDDDSHDNGSVAWMRCLLKIQNIMRLPESVRHLVMKRYFATICYTNMKNYVGKIFDISFKVDLGPAFNPNASSECFSVLNDETIIFTPEQISSMNINHGGRTAVASYGIKWGEPLTDSNGEVLTYYKNKADQDDPNVDPSVHYRPYVDFDNPCVAGKFMNGGVSNYDIVKEKCISFGMSDQEAEQHIETLIQYSGNISVVSTVDDQEQIKKDLVKMWHDDPLDNRKEDKVIHMNINEVLYYMIQKINNPLIVQCLLTAQYILDNHGTAPLVPSLQKMYELMNDGIPEGIVVEKVCSYIEHSEVIAKIDVLGTEMIDNLNKSLDIDTYLEISDELIEDVKTNCEDALIRTFISNTQTEIAKIEVESTSDDSLVSDDTQSECCVICQESCSDAPLSCGHAFHSQCILHWALSINCSNHNCCPTCREPFGPRINVY